MISQIEDAIVKRVKQRLDAGAGKVAVQKGTQGIPQPAVYVSTEEARYERASNAAFRAHLTVYLDVIFSSLKDEQARRSGIYLLLEGITQTLLLQTLGLKITPIIPKGFRNATTDELLKKGLTAYSLEMETSYYVIRLDDEQVVDLLRMGLDYYMKPGDLLKDASDAITL